MGIEFHALNLLLFARRRGVSFSKTCMIGRHGIHMTSRVCGAILRRHGLTFNNRDIEALYKTGFAEELFLRFLGANIVESFDASDYEGATHLADMNVLFEPRTHYNVVVDFGTLEHCFHVPNAFTNVINLCEDDGYIIHMLPTNNFCGHGFYQFSPELFFSMYSLNRGFELNGVYLAKEGATKYWWQVQSPIDLKGRVTFCNSIETHILVVAKKLKGAITPAQKSPFQSDYETLNWRGVPIGHFKPEEVMGERAFKDWLLLSGIFGPARLAKRLVSNIASSWLSDNGLTRTNAGGIN